MADTAVAEPVTGAGAPAPSPMAPPRTDDLARQTVRGVGWTAGAQVARQVLTLATSIVVARVLGPGAFGSVAQVTVLANVANLLGDFGLGAALVQRTHIDERHPSTVFWAQAGLGLAVSLVVAACAPLIALFYGDPDLTMVTLVLAPNFLLSSLCTVQRGLLTRQMRFKATAVADVLSLVVAGAVGVSMALGGAGVYAIVAQNLSSTLAVLVILWGLSSFRPKRLFDREALRDLLPFSKNLLGYTLVNYAIRNGDNVLVGRLLGATALGLYTRGYSILLYPTRQVTAVVGKVMFASLSRINDDLDRLRRGYLRAVAVIALLTFPTMIGLSIVADDFVHALLGDKWAAAIPIIRVFCALGAVESIMATVGWIYQSTGRTDVLLRWSLILGGIPLAGIVVGSMGGSIESVTVGYVVGTTALLYPSFRITGNLIGMKPGEVVGAVRSVAIATGVMAAVVIGVDLLLPQSIPSLARLAVLGAIGAATYGTYVHHRKVDAYLELRAVLERRADRPEARIWHDPVLQLKLEQLRARRAAGATQGVLFVGTSQVLEGIDTEIAAPGFGSRAYNGALHRGTMALSERVVPELMMPVVAPRLVVLGLGISDFNANNTVRDDVVERFEACVARRGLRGRLRRAMHERSVLFRTLSAKGRGENVTLSKLKIGADGRGLEFEHATEYRVSEKKLDYIKNDIVRDYEVGGRMVADLERCVARIRAAGAEVVLLDMPSTEDLLAMLPPTARADYERELAAAAERCGVRVITSLRTMLDRSLYADCLHFNGAGMAAASAVVAADLADELARAR